MSKLAPTDCSYEEDRKLWMSYIVPEIRPEYQRTMVFYRLCQFLAAQMPENVKFLTSYVHVDNHHSQSIHEGLGMERIGKNKSGTGWHYRGEAAKAAAWLKG